ncbi:MAG: hypothetical protein Kow0080_32040 [Candidatus Promineifilaceae bacterium]
MFKQAASKQMMGPWPDMATARFLLRVLTGLEKDVEPLPTADFEETLAQTLGDWLVQVELGPLAHARLTDVCPSLAQKLQRDVYVAAAQSTIHWQNLDEILDAFNRRGVPVVLMKGAALGQSVYAEPLWRIMSDVDLWVRDEDVEQAMQLLQGLGYGIGEKEKRPLALQLQADGEISFEKQGMKWGLVELHLSPFPGWWLKRTAVIDKTAVWQRIEPLPDGRAFQLASEDAVLLTAVHLAVNHQFDILTIRHLVDIAFTAKKRCVDWAVVAERAKQWRVAAAVYLVLDIFQQLVGLDEIEPARQQLRPSLWRRWLLGRFVSGSSVLAGRELKNTHTRYLYLLLLVDSAAERLKLILRAVWPEQEWLAARYGQANVSRWRHMWNVIRYGRI